MVMTHLYQQITILQLVLWVNQLIGNYQQLGETVIIAMLRQPIMNTLLSQIHTGPGSRVEKHASSFATGIWKSTRQLAAVKPGCISMQQM